MLRAGIGWRVVAWLVDQFAMCLLPIVAWAVRFGPARAWSIEVSDPEL